MMFSALSAAAVPVGAMASTPDVEVKASRVHPHSVLVEMNGPERIAAFAVLIPTRRADGGKGPLLTVTVGREANRLEKCVAVLQVPADCTPVFAQVTPLTSEPGQNFTVEW